jgi:SagB-type dehydrogenase family enzyme
MRSPDDPRPTLYELYHANSRVDKQNDISRFTITPTRHYIISSSFQRYDDRPKIDAIIPERSYIDDVLDKRGSTNPFRGELTLAELSEVMWRSTRVNRAWRARGAVTSRRVYPSGGALYGVELYVACRGVTDVPKGIYHWSPLDQAFEQLWLSDGEEWPAELPGLPSNAGTPAAVVFFVGIFQKVNAKYGERGYRLVNFEAGAIAMLMQTIAAEREVPCRWISGFTDVFWDRELHLNGVSESCLLSLGLG